MPSIVIRLPQDRTKSGTLRLRNDAGGTVAGPFAVVGKADGNTATVKGNPGRSPILPYGDTPIGTYRVTNVIQTGPGTLYNPFSYGPHGGIHIQPTGGEAQLAAQVGRTGLMIHGGDLNPSGKLRPTNGCLRLSNQDMKILLDAIVTLSLSQGLPDSCAIENGFESTAVVIGTDEGYNEGDPPPGIDGSILPSPLP